MLICSPFFFNVRGFCPCYIVKSPGASRPERFWKKKQLLPGRCCGVFRRLRPLIWPQPAAKKSSHRKWESAAWAGKIVLSCFQGLASPYLAAAGHQKSSRRKWESEPGKTFRDSRRDIFHYLGLQAEELWAKIWHGFPFFVDCENWEEQLSNFWRTTKNESVVLFLLLLESCSFAPLIFSMCGGFALVTLSKVRARSWKKKQLLPGWRCVFSVAGAALGSEMWAFGLGIFGVFCHYMLSSGGFVVRFCPIFQFAPRLTWRQPFPAQIWAPLNL